MELSFQSFIDIFQIIAGLGTTGAFIYAGLTFRRVRHSEQITIAHEIQDDLSQKEKDLEEILTKSENIANSFINILTKTSLRQG
jgi:hypothetical protein